MGLHDDANYLSGPPHIHPPLSILRNCYFVPGSCLFVCVRTGLWRFLWGLVSFFLLLFFLFSYPCWLIYVLSGSLVG